MDANVVSVLSTSNKPELQRFVSLERKLLKDHPQYISEIDADVMKLLTKKSAFSKEMDFCLFVASRTGEDVARCAALINRRYQAEKGEAVGFVGFFAAVPGCGAEVAEMVGQAERWLQERGVTRIIAPCNGGMALGMGVLADGFDASPMFPFPWHPSYYRGYIEASGYAPTYPMWYYEIDFSAEKYRQAKQRYAGATGVELRPISKKEWKRDLETIRHLINETFEEEWEFCSFTGAEMDEFFGQMKPILDPQQLLIAEMDGKPVGFCIALPDLTPLFRSFNGRVGLIEIFKLLTKSKKYDRAGIIAIGVTSQGRGKGVAKAIALKVYARHEELGLKKALYYPVNEGNVASRGLAESLGGTGRVMYQVYDKAVG